MHSVRPGYQFIPQTLAIIRHVDALEAEMGIAYFAVCVDSRDRYAEIKRKLVASGRVAASCSTCPES